MESGSIFDLLKGALVLAGIALAAMGIVSIVLSFFVAVRSTPARRAAWTAGIAYASIVVGAFFLDLHGIEAWTAVIALPGALLTFLYWWLGFRSAWVADAADGSAGGGP